MSERIADWPAHERAPFEDDDEDQCPDCGMVEHWGDCEDDGFAEHDADDAIKDALYEDGAS